MDDQLRELKTLNRTMAAIRDFIVAQLQLTKTLVLESQKQSRVIQEIKIKLEEK